MIGGSNNTLTPINTKQTVVEILTAWMNEDMQDGIANFKLAYNQRRIKTLSAPGPRVVCP